MNDTTVDWTNVETLLNVVDLSRQWPTLKALSDEALEALTAINADVAAARVKRAADAKAKADADAAAAKAKADELEAKKVAAEAKIQAPLFRSLSVEPEHAA